ncbi:hypothetical protein TrST_g319 [Triparma strigata]|uniref:Uncharacterized protein n=1 Tax=Triparma strigata TaxID=1606541 RepID=A0A9W6ZI98_9STRA|nr:hypothetical protein TrST_g319 [Triparma strigata]
MFFASSATSPASFLNITISAGAHAILDIMLITLTAIQPCAIFKYADFIIHLLSYFSARRSSSSLLIERHDPSKTLTL